MIPLNSVKIIHKEYGEGRIIEINPLHNGDARIFVQWKNNKSIVAGWYGAKDPNIEFVEKK
jgi:hypothetical protein